MAILALYPYASSLHLAVATRQNLMTATLSLNLKEEETVKEIETWLTTLPIQISDLKLAVTSGFLPPNYKSGLYALSSNHTNLIEANLGLRLANVVTSKWKTPIYLIDPTSSLEWNPLALVTGTPDLNRGCLCDSFIFKYLARQEEVKRGLPLNTGRFIIAYLDEEIQFGVVEQGRLVDGGSSGDEGPFAWQQAGSLPFDGLLDLCLKLEEKEATLDRINKGSGIKAYLGYDDFTEFFKDQGQRKDEIVAALAYQIGKEVGSYATVLQGKIDSLIFCGELTKEHALMENLGGSLGFLGTFSPYEGNQGIQALINGAARIQGGERLLEL